MLIGKEKSSARVAAGRINGKKGVAARWGTNHGKTVTIRAFADAACLLKTIPERDRAAFVSNAIFEYANRHGTVLTHCANQ